MRSPGSFSRSARSWGSAPILRRLGTGTPRGPCGRKAFSGIRTRSRKARARMPLDVTESGGSDGE
eukprot:scaffold7337_cov220-Pinguiococcus_pyrenoidosus.AAC.1